MTTEAIHAPPHPVHRLEALVGSWDWNGRSKDGTYEVSGTDEFEWLDGRYFLMERHNLIAGGSANIGVAIYRWDEGRNACVAEYFDNDGNHDSYEISIETGAVEIRWTRFRFRGRLADDGDVITGTWEHSPDGVTWDYWYDLRLTRRPAAPAR